MIKIIDSHEFHFKHGRKNLCGFVDEGKTVWSVSIRYKRNFLAENWTEKKSANLKTPQEALDCVFEKVKYKLEVKL